MSVELNDIASGYSTGLINNNFQKVEEELNQNVLRRDGLDPGEGNQMNVDLDMNSNRIYNLPEPTLEHEAARLKDVQNALEGGPGQANLVEFTSYKRIDAQNVQAALKKVVDDQFITEELLKDAPLNGEVNPVQLFSMTAKEELSYLLTGQNPQQDVPNVTGSIMAECYVEFPSMYASSWTHTPFRFINASTGQLVPDEIGGGTGLRAIPISAVHVVNANTPVDVPLFEPARIGESAMYAFRYLGEEPLHTVVKGNIQFLRRVTVDAEADPSIQYQIRLGTWPNSELPSWERGQAQGDNWLGGHSASGTELFELIEQEFVEIIDTDSALEALLENEPEMNNDPLVNGWISIQDPENPVLQPPEDAEEDYTPEERANIGTTEWIGIVGGEWYRLLPLPAPPAEPSGVSTRGRIQYRNSEGEISYQDIGSADGLIKAPDEAVEFRVYCRSPLDFATNMSVKHVTAGLLGSRDLLRGRWQRVHIPLQARVVFYPGNTYSLILNANRTFGTNITTTSYAFRIEGGGLYFLADISRMIKQRAALIGGL